MRYLSVPVIFRFFFFVVEYERGIIFYNDNTDNGFSDPHEGPTFSCASRAFHRDFYTLSDVYRTPCLPRQNYSLISMPGYPHSLDLSCPPRVFHHDVLIPLKNTCQLSNTNSQIFFLIITIFVAVVVVVFVYLGSLHVI